MMRSITFICSRKRFPTQLSWDVENKLQGVKDNAYLSLYQYDANGERTYKLTGSYVAQNRSGVWRSYYSLTNATLYASPYMVATVKGYTKHYYAENERIASRIGDGGLSHIDTPIVDLTLCTWKLNANSTCFDTVAQNRLNANNYTASHLLDTLYYWKTTHGNTESDCYWYHPDHLGSASWVTDKDGEVVQYLYYLPWGEDYKDQRRNHYSGSRYTFSAKEKDTETGYSYFGSRYYSSDLSIWLSVDPMAAKYPSLSPYVYCANNPIKLVDPNGEEMVEDPYLLFNGKTGTLEIWDDNDTPNDYSDDTFIGGYDAHNNVTKSSKGKWEDGIYDMLDRHKSHKHGNDTDDNGVLLDSPNGSYGTAGCYRTKTFVEKTTNISRKGMAVHAGRENKPFLDRKTLGCIRTTPEAMEAIGDAISKYGPLQKIIIQFNRTSTSSEEVNNISPQASQPQSKPLLQIQPVYIQTSPIAVPDKTRVAPVFSPVF